MVSGQLTQKQTHQNKNWSTHPISWITHPSFWSTHPCFLDDPPKFLDNSPNYFFHNLRQNITFSHSIDTDIHKYTNVNMNISSTFVITAIQNCLKL